MANVAVDIYVLEEAAPNDPIQGVDVYVYLPGVSFVTQVTTDVDGLAALLLPENNTYELRFYKTGVTLPGRQLLVVGASSLEAIVHGTLQEDVVSNYSRYCLVQGTCLGWSRAVPKGLTIQFRPVDVPQTVDDVVIMESSLAVPIDEAGYAQVLLLRGQAYVVDIPGYLTPERKIYVPDALSAKLSRVLFPTISSIVISVGGALAVGESRELTPEVWTNAPFKLEGAATEDLEWTSSDTAVLQVTACEDKVTLLGIAQGTASLTATRKDTTHKSLPAVEISGVPVTVTVA